MIEEKVSHQEKLKKMASEYRKFTFKSTVAFLITTISIISLLIVDFPSRETPFIIIAMWGLVILQHFATKELQKDLNDALKKISKS